MRRLRMTGPEIVELLGMANPTVSAVLDRIGLGKLSLLEPPNRYERKHAGAYKQKYPAAWPGISAHTVRLLVSPS